MFPWDYPKPVFSKRDWYSSWVLAASGALRTMVRPSDYRTTQAPQEAKV